MVAINNKDCHNNIRGGRQTLQLCLPAEVWKIRKLPSDRYVWLWKIGCVQILTDI